MAGWQIVEWRVLLGFLCLLLVRGVNADDAEKTSNSPVATDVGTSIGTTEPLRVSTRGFEGALLVSGMAGPDQEALTTFLTLAGKKNSRIVCVELSSVAATQNEGQPTQPLSTRPTTAEISARLAQAWLEQGGLQFLVARIDPGQELSDELLGLFDSATGIWIEGRDAKGLARWLTQPKVETAMRQHRSRGKILGGSIELAEAISDGWVESLESTTQPGDQPNSTRWLDRLIIAPSSASERLKAALAKQPSRVALQLSDHAALLIRQRDVVAVSDGEIQVRYAPIEGRRDPGQTLNGMRRLADLTALVRAAVDRLLPVYPPEKVGEPRVEKGTLVIVGGGGTPPGLMKRFVDFAGGTEAVIAVLPISNPDPLPEKDGAAEAFRRLGAKEVRELTGRTPEAVDQQATWELLDRATGIWFGGGRQWRFVDAYEGTKSLEKMRGVLARGGVIGGSSAGATIQGDYLARGHPLGPHIMMADGYERSFAFLPGAAIDQHFTQRKRVGDLLTLLQRYPQFLGLGIDEATALIVRGSVGEVVGKHHVHIFDTRRPGADGRPHEDSLPEGARYDLVLRRVVEEAQVEKEPKEKVN